MLRFKTVFCGSLGAGVLGGVASIILSSLLIMLSSWPLELWRLVRRRRGSCWRSSSSSTSGMGSQDCLRVGSPVTTLSFDRGTIDCIPLSNTLAVKCHLWSYVPRTNITCSHMSCSQMSLRSNVLRSNVLRSNVTCGHMSSGQISLAVICPAVKCHCGQMLQNL